MICLRVGFLWFYPVWYLLIFLNLYICLFGGAVSCYLKKIFFLHQYPSSLLLKLQWQKYYIFVYYLSGHWGSVYFLPVFFFIPQLGWFLVTYHEVCWLFSLLLPFCYWALLIHILLQISCFPVLKLPFIWFSFTVSIFLLKYIFLFLSRVFTHITGHG